MAVVIHRDRTFTYRGEVFWVLAGGPGWGYEVVRERDGAYAADGLMSMCEVRAWLREMEAGGWDLVEVSELRGGCESG